MGVQALKKRSTKKPLELDITSLLDILVILLVFLLKTYNPEESLLKLVDDLTLPLSQAKDVRENFITLQIDSKRSMWIGEKEIGVLEKSMEGTKIEFLYTALIKERTEFKDDERSPSSELNESDIEKKAVTVNIVMDRDLPYSVLKNIMYTLGLAGFEKFKFVVLGDEF